MRNDSGGLSVTNFAFALSVLSVNSFVTQELAANLQSFGVNDVERAEVAR
jgi:hypothetical protein